MIGEISGVAFKRLVEVLYSGAIVRSRGVGVYEAARASGECPEESSKDFHGSREAAPIGLPAI